MVCRLFETSYSKGQSPQNPIQACKTHQSISLNVLQKLEQFQNYHNILYQPVQQNHIQACKTNQFNKSECPTKAGAVLESLSLT